MSQTRPHTREEMQAMLLEHVRNLVDHWERESRVPDVRGKLEGLAFSILATLDGDAATLPSYTVSPAPHAADEACDRDAGRNWYPAGVDIAGDLHDRLSEPK